MINYIFGDAVYPAIKGQKIIVHICNDVGRWGKGFVLAISKRWKKPEQDYKDWYLSQKNTNKIPLGTIQSIKVEKDIWVVNMIAQQGLRSVNGVPPIRYNALETCLRKVASHAGRGPLFTIHMPRIGCGLAGGKWSEIEPIIKNTLNTFEVFVYDLK